MTELPAAERLTELYRRMVRARAFELLMADLWHEGRISAELHLGTGEEAVAAAVTDHLRQGDAMALDHRSTAPITALGGDLDPILAEVLGRRDGLCGGHGGHMHLLDPERLLASSGIVGAAGPIGAGFALAAKRLRPRSLAVAFFGDGAANQGMLLESLNLARAWSLPVVFVCKDNRWAITTPSSMVTAGNLADRARGFDISAEDVDGGDVLAVWKAVERGVERAREGRGPTFVRARCPRLDGHLLGDPMLRSVRHPLHEARDLLTKVATATVARSGGGLGDRAKGLGRMMGVLAGARGADERGERTDPLVRARRTLGKRKVPVERIEAEVDREMETLCARVLGEERRRWAG